MPIAYTSTHQLRSASLNLLSQPRVLPLVPRVFRQLAQWPLYLERLSLLISDLSKLPRALILISKLI